MTRGAGRLLVFSGGCDVLLYRIPFSRSISLPLCYKYNPKDFQNEEGFQIHDTLLMPSPAGLLGFVTWHGTVHS
jgi:hypothetical protein